MYTFLVVMISILAVLLCVVILLQSGKGGGLAAAFGGASSSMDTFIGGRQAATLLTRLTWIGGSVFLLLSLVLAILSSRSGAPPESILRGEFGGAGTPASVLETEGAAPPAGTEGAVGEEGAAGRAGAAAEQQQGGGEGGR